MTSKKGRQHFRQQ